jgi:hypothetical protein
MINLGRQTRIRLACRTVVMLQAMRVRLTAMAMTASGLGHSQLSIPMDL